MRVVSIGIPITKANVDNHSLANAPTLFDYDACVIDMRAVSEQIEAMAEGTREFRTPDEREVQAGGSGAFHFGLGDLLEQRREELRRLVERGGTVVALAYPNVPHASVTTLPGLDRYYLLPAPAEVVYRPPFLKPGSGQQISTSDGRHAAAVYLDDQSGRLRYQAHFEPAAVEHFEQVGSVLARSVGGAVVAVELRRGAGRILLVPPPAQIPRGDTRARFSESLLETLQRAAEEPTGERAPAWLKHYELPNLNEAESSAREARAAFGEAESRVVEAEAFLADASKYQALLWGSGRRGFEAVVRDAFRLLGFDVGADLDRPAELRDGTEVVLLEVEAADGTASERPYLTLQRRVESHFLRAKKRLKGVIVVNGERLTAPSARRAPYRETLENACETFGYALIPAQALFALVSYALEGPDEETLSEIRASIVGTTGLVEVEESDGAEEEAPRSEAEAEEEADPGEDAIALEAPLEAATPADEAGDEPEPVGAEADSGD